MAISQGRSRRKPSGGMYKDYRKKKHYECGKDPVNTRVGETKGKGKRMKGGSHKTVLLRANTMNAFDPKTKKCLKAVIKNVVDNPANRNFIRANILTMGTIVNTDKGQARITNRPGQEGTVNGVLI